MTWLTYLILDVRMYPALAFLSRIYISRYFASFHHVRGVRMLVRRRIAAAETYDHVVELLNVSIANTSEVISTDLQHRYSSLIISSPIPSITYIASIIREAELEMSNRYITFLLFANPHQIQAAKYSKIPRLLEQGQALSSKKGHGMAVDEKLRKNVI